MQQNEIKIPSVVDSIEILSGLAQRYGHSRGGIESNKPCVCGAPTGGPISTVVCAAAGVAFGILRKFIKLDQLFEEQLLKEQLEKESNDARKDHPGE